MNNSYISLGIAALLPVVLSSVLMLLETRTKFANLNNKIKQPLIGILFGALAILGTEWGIPIDGATVNCRDAAVLSAGLFFGGPAGIVAGLIGGIERWVAVAWGAGEFTRIACSVSTILAGFFAAAVRHFMLDDKNPNGFLSLAIGIVVETFHLTMVFVTNMKTPDDAIRVVMACSIPMIIANGVSTMLSGFVIMILKNDSSDFFRKNHRISQIIQRLLLLTVSIAFVISTSFLFQLQTGISQKTIEKSLETAVEETTADIEDASDANLIEVTREVVNDLAKIDDLNALASKYDLSEINIVNKEGIITDSTNKDFVGYDMKSGKQSQEFMQLTSYKTEFAQKYGPIAADENISMKYAGVRTATGFVQVGYDTVRFQKDVDREIVGITKNRHLTSNGYVIIVDEDFHLISAPDGYVLQAFESLKNAPSTYKKGEVFEAKANGMDCYCLYSSSEGYTIFSIMPRAESNKLRDVAMYVNTYMEILIFAVLFIFVYLIIKIAVVDKINDVNKSLTKITNGNLDETVDVRSSAEFSSLSDDINSTVDTLKDYIDEASARIDKELGLAKNIQASALPNIFPAFPKRKEFDIFASMNPAKSVGGDFYDFYFTRHNILNILIADVSGKGIPAAMFMMRAKSELKGLTETDLQLNDVFTKGNESLCNGNDAGMFVTAWQGRINLDNGVVQFANAGHNPPVVKHKDGSFEYLKSRAGFVLAGMEGIKYRPQELQIEVGDIIYLYTDGVTEATNSNNELYGEERLLNILNSRDFDSMEELCRTVKADVDSFVGEAEQFDDITMLAFKYLGDNVPQIKHDEARIEDIPAVTDFVNAEMEKLDCSMKTVIQMNVAIDEIYSNIAKFAYPDSNGPVTVKVQELEEPRAVSVTFIDEGVPYNPLVKADPDVTLSAEDREIGGLGIYMVKKTMDDMQYRYESDCNILTIIKNI